MRSRKISYAFVQHCTKTCQNNAFLGGTGLGTLVYNKKNTTLESEDASSNISFILKIYQKKRCEIFVYRHFLSPCSSLFTKISRLQLVTIYQSALSMHSFKQVLFLFIHFRIRSIFKMF